MSSWSVYILRCADKSLYTGITTDLNRRVSEHNTSTLGARYTRSRRPVQCVFEEILPDRSSASKRESEIKKLAKREKLALIQKYETTFKRV